MSAEGKEETGQGGMALGCGEGEVRTWQGGGGGQEEGRRGGWGGVLKERKKGEEGLIKG